MNKKRKQKVLMLAIKLFGSCEPYTTLSLDDAFVPVLIRHDGHGTDLDKAYWNGNEWTNKENEWPGPNRLRPKRCRQAMCG